MDGTKVCIKDNRIINKTQKAFNPIGSPQFYIQLVYNATLS